MKQDTNFWPWMKWKSQNCKLTDFTHFYSISKNGNEEWPIRLQISGKYECKRRRGLERLEQIRSNSEEDNSTEII